MGKPKETAQLPEPETAKILARNGHPYLAASLAFAALAASVCRPPSGKGMALFGALGTIGYGLHNLGVF